jgi:hypothetical protein
MAEVKDTMEASSTKIAETLIFLSGCPKNQPFIILYIITPVICPSLVTASWSIIRVSTYNHPKKSVSVVPISTRVYRPEGHSRGALTDRRSSTKEHPVPKASLRGSAGQNLVWHRECDACSISLIRGCQKIFQVYLECGEC